MIIDDDREFQISMNKHIIEANFCIAGFFAFLAACITFGAVEINLLTSTGLETVFNTTKYAIIFLGILIAIELTIVGACYSGVKYKKSIRLLENLKYRSVTHANCRCAVEIEACGVEKGEKINQSDLMVKGEKGKVRKAKKDE